MKLERAGPIWRLASQVVFALVFAAAQGGPLGGEAGRAPKPPVERLPKEVAERETRPPKATTEKVIKATLVRPTKVAKPPVDP